STFLAQLRGQSPLTFGPPEFLAFMILAFVLLANLSADAPLKGALMIALGLFLSSIGINPMDSYPRFTFGTPRRARILRAVSRDVSRRRKQRTSRSPWTAPAAGPRRTRAPNRAASGTP